MKDEKPKLVKLLGVLRDLREKEQAVLDEINDLLGGGVGIGAKLKLLYTRFAEAWHFEYREPYVFNYTKDAPQMKRLIKAMSVEEIDARILSYVQNQDPFFTRSRHSFAMFVATINQHVGLPKAAIDPLEAEVAETQRKRRELSR